nr:tripartite motif-containing protein 42-like [Crassostrea gigas]
MDQGRSTIQDVIRCDLCKDNIVQSYCDFCHFNLCKPCIGEHISDGYDKHKIVSFQQRRSTLIYPKCKTHPNKTCELQSKQNSEFICTICSASDQVKGHDFVVLDDQCKTKKIDIKRDIEELEEIICPTYVDIANNLEKQISNLDKEYEKLTSELSRKQEEWHKEIDKVVNKLEDKISGFKEKHQHILVEHLDEIKKIETSIQKILLAFRELEESNVVSDIMEYRPRNKEFCQLPPKVTMSMTTFHPKTINSD